MTRPKSLRRSLGAAVALLAIPWLAASARAATCGPAPGIVALAGVAFVGTMTAVDSAGTEATFAVEEVWKGGELASEVEVIGPFGLQWADPSMAGARYLVLATVVGGRLQMGAECNQAYLWDPSMAAGRPSSAHPPATDEDAGVDVPIPLIVIAGIVVLVAAVSALAFRSPPKAPE